MLLQIYIRYFYLDRIHLENFKNWYSVLLFIYNYIDQIKIFKYTMLAHLKIYNHINWQIVLLLNNVKSKLTIAIAPLFACCF